MILSCSHITKAFGDHTVVSDATFHIEEHEKAAIIGINGAGKSTLLKIIVGELESDTGNLFWQDIGLSCTTTKLINA